MRQLDFSRISSPSVTFKHQTFFSAWSLWLMVSAFVPANAQVGCPPKPGTPVCISCSEAKVLCSELKTGNQDIYEKCLSNCSEHCPPPPPGPPSTIVAPFDLTWKAVDLNGLPLNPRWALQDSPACPSLPTAVPQTEPLCAKPWTTPCTTQPTQEIPLPPFLDPTHLGFVCSGHGINGHHENWAVVTYSGAAQWVEHSSWSSDNFGSDDDYNIVISREDESAYTQDNPNGVLTEFDSDETIDNFVTPWWKAFHDAVDQSNAAAESMLTLNGKPAYIVEVGWMGLDCAHDCSSEIHPTYALAVHTKDDPADDEWAIFGRNWGDEGFCAIGEVVAQDLTTIYLTLPWYPGAADTAPVVTGSVWEKNGQSIQVTTFPQFSGSSALRGGTGFVIELDLGEAYSGPLVHGEIHLKWNMLPGSTSAQLASSAAPAAPMKSVPSATANTKPVAPEAEEAFAKYVAGLPPDTQSKIKAAMVRTHPSPTWIDFHATNLSQAPAGFQAHPFRYTSGANGAWLKSTIRPDPAKASAVDKINSILQEANAPKPPGQ